MKNIEMWLRRLGRESFDRRLKSLVAVAVALGSLTFLAQDAVAAGTTKLFPSAGAASSTFVTPATAAATNGPSTVGEICMQKVFGTPVTNSNKLGCTANDIRISRAISVSPSSCTKGTKFDLTGTFETIVTANVRYDAGFFFRVDGGANARGDGVSASGSCSLSSMTPGVSPSVNSDGDTCGDLTAGTYNLTFTIPDVECTDANNDNLLDLPNCTSWHSNQGTSCSASDPFTFQPDTKSKCACDDTFQVDVIVESPSISVEKTATPISVPESGGVVTFNVVVKNMAATVSATINSLKDLIGDTLSGTTVDLASISACGANEPSSSKPGPCTAANTTSCSSLIGNVLAAGAQTSCSFQMFIAGNTGDVLPDTVTACAGNNSSSTPSCASDNAEVSITDIFTEPTLTKDAISAACTVDVEYQVVVNNVSGLDTLTLNALSDDKFGVITTPHSAGNGVEEVVKTDCATGGVIAKSGSYSCKFTGRIQNGSCAVDHKNTIVGGVTDDDGENSVPSDSATVKITTTLQ